MSTLILWILIGCIAAAIIVSVVMFVIWNAKAKEYDRDHYKDIIPKKDPKK